MLLPLTPLSVPSCRASREKRQNRRRSHDPGERSTPPPSSPHYISLLTLESFSSLNRGASRPGKAETLTLRCCAIRLYSFSIARGCGASAHLTMHSAERMLWMWDYFSTYSYAVMQKGLFSNFILPACFSNEIQSVFASGAQSVVRPQPSASAFLS